MAYGGGLFVLSHQGAYDERQVVTQINRTGGAGASAWTSPTVHTQRTYSPPGIGYNAVYNRFVFVYPQRASDPYLCAMTAPVLSLFGQLYLGPFATPNCIAGDAYRSFRAPGVDCPAGYGTCLIAWPALDQYDRVVRTIVLGVNPGGTVVWQTGTLAFASGTQKTVRNLSIASAPSGTYKTLISRWDPIAQWTRFRWDSTQWSAPAYPNASNVTFSSTTEGHLAYGISWSEYVASFSAP